ncbi:hypothetical protein GCM10009657_39750 [Oryzihumus leptocrescens]
MDTMSRRLNNTVLRGAAAVVLAGGAALALAGGARADGLPLPLPSTPSLPAPAPSSSTSLLPARVDLNLPVLKQAPQPPASPLPPVSAAPAPAPLVDGLTQASTGVKGALDQVGQATAGTPLSLLNTSGAAARLAAVTVDADPLATACVQATGTGTGLANVDLTALGADVGTPVQQTLPGVVNACPAGTGAGTGNGTPGTGTDTLATAGATAGSLVGACARLTTSVVPVESTVVVLDQDLVTSLTKAGLPLDQLVVPCPTDGNGGGGSGGGTGGTGGDSGGSGGASGSAGTGTGGPSSAASDVPSLGGSLPFTGAQVSLFLVLASALLASGATLVARARRAGTAAVRLV